MVIAIADFHHTIVTMAGPTLQRVARIIRFGRCYEACASLDSPARRSYG